MFFNMNLDSWMAHDGFKIKNNYITTDNKILR